jgi:hypothetical protein
MLSRSPYPLQRAQILPCVSYSFGTASLALLSATSVSSAFSVRPSGLRAPFPVHPAYAMRKLVLLLVKCFHVFGPLHIPPIPHVPSVPSMPSVHPSFRPSAEPSFGTRPHVRRPPRQLLRPPPVPPCIFLDLAQTRFAARQMLSRLRTSAHTPPTPHTSGPLRPVAALPQISLTHSPLDGPSPAYVGDLRIPETVSYMPPLPVLHSLPIPAPPQP